MKISNAILLEVIKKKTNTKTHFHLNRDKLDDKVFYKKVNDFLNKQKDDVIFYTFTYNNQLKSRIAVKKDNKYIQSYMDGAEKTNWFIDNNTIVGGARIDHRITGNEFYTAITYVEVFYPYRGKGYSSTFMKYYYKSIVNTINRKNITKVKQHALLESSIMKKALEKMTILLKKEFTNVQFKNDFKISKLYK